MDPTGPSQPTADTAYNVRGNPADQSQAEERNAASNAHSGNDASLVDARERGDVPVPSTHEEGQTSTSLGYGVRDSSGDKGGSWGVPNTDAEQMKTYGEGEVADAQNQKSGFGEQMDLASDLDRKKAEQADQRAAVKEQRQQGIDVGGALGDRGGPSVVEGR